MTQPPSIKGRIFGPAVEDVNKLLARGDLAAEELGRWLEPGDLPLLGQAISATEWYDVRSYVRLAALLRDVEGHGSNDYLRERGVRSAERLLEAGLYSQLEYLGRVQVARESDPQKRFLAFGRDLKLLTTLSASILSFSRWNSLVDPEQKDRYLIEVSDAKDFPDVLGFTSEGFVNGMARQHGAADLWRWERARPDLVLLRMVRSV